MNNYYPSFSERGEQSLPSNQEIEEHFQNGIKPMVFIDSCICLHIIKVIDHGRKATNVDFQKIINLKQYIDQHPDIEVSPFFGFIELCSRDGNIDLVKFQDFLHRINFFKKMPLKKFKQFNFNFLRDYSAPDTISSTFKNSLSALEPSLKNTYCALLKLRSLAMITLSSKNAEQSLMSFLDWMASELNSVRAAEYKLAMNIFGGNTAYRKMIGLDSKPADAKKKLLGTSWDVFHSKHTANSFRLSQMLNENAYPFFVTSDANLFNIFKNFSVTVVNDGGDDYLSSFLMNSDFTFPHLTESFITKQNEKVINHFIDRRNQIYSFDDDKINKLIRTLEMENGIIE